MTFLPDIALPVLLVLGVAMLAFAVWRMLVSPGKRLAWLRRSLLVLLALGMALRPGVPGGEVPTGSINVNVFLVIDTSQSIAAEDWDGAPRLTGIRADVRDIAYAFAGSNLSVITFDSQPQLRVPLTDDGSAVIEMVNALRPEAGFTSHGTSISIARDMLSNEIDRATAAHPGAPTVVFYLGDGEQTTEDAPASFAELADKVDAGFVLGYGTDEGGRMLEETFKPDAEPRYVQDPAGGDAISKIDEAALQGIASQLGISYLHRTPAAALAPSLGAMTAEQGDVDLSSTAEARLELAWVLAVPFFVLLLWELLATVAAAIATRRRT